MKIYFFDEKRAGIVHFVDPEHEPAHIAAFDLEEGQSTFIPRYALEDGKLVDKYSGKTDEEVAAAINQAELDKAAELEAQFNPPAKKK
jgi:hypothetical protein